MKNASKSKFHLVLRSFTRGTDGLYYKMLNFGDKTEIICCNSDGNIRYVQHIANDSNSNIVKCVTA